MYRPMWEKGEVYYLTEEKFYPLNTSNKHSTAHYEEYPITICGPTIILTNLCELLSTQGGRDTVTGELANTIMHLSHDGRFSQNNKEWAKTLVPDADWQTRDYIVTSHPAVLDGFINQARRYIERDREPDKADISELEKETSGQNSKRPNRKMT